MLPIPLHPALVHFPIVFVVLMPIVAGITLWAIRRGSRPARVWLAPLALAVALSGSAWLAVETGKDQEERVEKVVSETVLDVHADAAERFMYLSFALTGLVALGLLRGRAGDVVRGASLVAAAALTFAGYQVGHSGGQLVYEHGAASAYTHPSSTAAGE